MGREAAKTVLRLIRDEIPHPRPTAITVYPRLVVRESTGPVASERAADNRLPA
jgi:DNA-binding LacI/PurR family transcriptional regulator